MDKILPKALDVERSVLGSLLITPTLIHSVIEKLPFEAFYGSNNREIYKAIVDMEDNEKIPDVVTLAEYLREKSKLESVGGALYISELTEEVSTSKNIDAWVEILIKKHKLRMRITDLSGIVNTAFSPEADDDAIQSQIEASNERIDSVGSEKECRSHKKGRIARISEYRSEVKEYYDNGIEKIGTPFGEWPIFSEYFRIIKGTLNVITGIPGHGKTTLGDQIMTDSLHKKMKWAMLSFEGIPYLHIKSLIEKLASKPFFGNYGLNNDLFSSFFDMLNEYVYIIEPFKKNATVKSFIKLVKQAKEEFDIDGAIIDPWNQMFHEYEGRETLYIRDSLRDLKANAKELDIAQFIIAHPKMLYKKPNQTTYSVPTLYDLEGSAHWFNSTDNGLTCYRHRNDDKRKEYVEVHIQKIKELVYGKEGVCYFRYNYFNGGKLHEITYGQAKAGHDDVQAVQSVPVEDKQESLNWVDKTYG